MSSVTGKTEVAELVLPRGIIFGDLASPHQTVYEQSATAEYLVGTKLMYGDGREFRYARAGATALVKSLMCQTALIDADMNNEDQTGNFPVAGDTTITVEVATGLALIELENELAGGYLTVADGPDEGSLYNIVGSKFGSTDTNLSLVIDSPIRTTWTMATQITLIQSMWMNTLVYPTTVTGIAVGVPLLAVTADYYYWSQTGGACAIICDATETIAIGGPVGAAASMAVAGRVGLNVTVTQRWGLAMTTENTAAEAVPVWLTLP